MKRLFLILLGFCFPVFGFAQSQFSTATLFNPPAISNGTDLSISYLGDMFGVVDGVLHGSGSQIMGQMFMVFNAGALILGGIIVIYTSLISLMNTAHEGEVMGKKWSSIWIPLRTVGGIALLIPKATGYCAIQIFMMWVIVQGVGLADTVWNQATNYIAAGGVIVQQSLQPSANITGPAQNMFYQSVCLAGLQTLFNNAYQTAVQNNQTPPAVPNFFGSINPLQPIDPSTCPKVGTFCAPVQLGSCPSGNCTVQIPYFPNETTNGYNWSQLNGACGTVTWPQLSSTAQGNASNISTSTSINSQTGLPVSTTNATINQEVTQAYEQALQVGVQQILLDMSGPAQAVINNSMFPPSGVTPDITLTNYLNNRMFLDAAEDYEGIVYPAQQNTADTAQSSITNQWIATSQAVGWIEAGAYYLQMASVNSNVGSEIFNSAPTASSASNIVSGSSGPAWGLTGTNGTITTGNLNGLPASMATNVINGLPALTAALSGSGTTTYLTTFVGSAPTSSSNYGDAEAATGTQKFMSGSSVAGGVLGVILYPLLGPLIPIIQSFNGLEASQQLNANPVVELAQLGDGLMELVIEVWIIGAVTLGVATGALSAIPCVNEGNVPIVITEWIIPFVWGICGLIFVEGAIMEYYIPLIPYMLFLFGAIGWLIATLEAMVAAPLIALGITHPEGQEVLGKADPAVLLLVNVFLRPSMMIIGFIGGIILSYVSVWLLNQGFFQAFPSLSSSLIVVIFGFPAKLIIYVGLVIALVNYSFQLINVVPDKVMRWIGGQVEGIAGEAGKMAGEAKQGVSQAAQGAGQGMADLAKAAGSKADKSGTAKGKVENEGDKPTATPSKDGKDLNISG